MKIMKHLKNLIDNKLNIVEFCQKLNVDNICEMSMILQKVINKLLSPCGLFHLFAEFIYKITMMMMKKKNLNNFADHLNF